MQPPRALWVPFPLGRPLGKPGDAPFQQGVIQAALDLLHRQVGPVLEDYPHDAPTIDDKTLRRASILRNRNSGPASGKPD